VTAKDVLWPFCIFLFLNLFFLTIQTIVDPYVWIRVPIDDDDETNTRGQCGYEGDVGGLLEGLLGLVNVIALIILCVQAYRARDIRSEFSEARGVLLALFSMLQATIIVAPMQALLEEDNTNARYILSVLYETTTSLTLLLFIFGPIIAHNRKFQRDGGSLATHPITGVDDTDPRASESHTEQQLTLAELREAKGQISDQEVELRALRSRNQELEDLLGKQRETAGNE